MLNFLKFFVFYLIYYILLIVHSHVYFLYIIFLNLFIFKYVPLFAYL